MPPQTRRTYTKELQSFLSGCKCVAVRAVADAEVDAAVVKYMTMLYTAGHQASRGERLLAGLLHYAPE